MWNRAVTLRDAHPSPQNAGSDKAALQGIDIADTTAVVLRNSAVNDAYFHLVLKVDGLALNARAGQFFNIACPTTGRDQPYLRRPMSLYRVSPEEGVVEFLCKATGVGTHTLSGLRMGDELNILGPLGNGFRVDPRWKSIAVVGRGVGLATLAPLAEMAAANGISVTAILSARTKTYIMSQERFLEAGASVENLTDEDGTSSLQNVERILLGLIERKRVDALFTCGSNRLMLLLKRLSKKFDVPGQVALEQQMACGLGMCFCCVRNIQIGDHVEQKRVCHDGPVFTLSEAMSW